MKSSPFGKGSRGLAGPQPTSSRFNDDDEATSQSSVGYSVEGDGDGLDYATMAQLKAVAAALQPSRPAKQQAKLKPSFSEQKKAQVGLLKAKGGADRQGLASEIHQQIAANAFQALEAGNIKARSRMPAKLPLGSQNQSRNHAQKRRNSDGMYPSTQPGSIGPLDQDLSWKGQGSSMFKAQSRDSVNQYLANQLLQTPGAGEYTPNVNFVLQHKYASGVMVP